LQLVFFLLFYEDQNLDMPCHASEPMSKPVQPQALYFRPVLQNAGVLLATNCVLFAQSLKDTPFSDWLA